MAHVLARGRPSPRRDDCWSTSSTGVSRVTGSTGPRARNCRASSRRRVFARFRIGEGLEYLYDAKAEGRGTIIALPHIGSWEWGGSYLNSLGLGMTAVAEDLEPPELFAWFKAKRESIGIRIEPLDEHAGTVLLQTLKDGGVIGLLCDRDIQGNGIEVEFFGERVAPAGRVRRRWRCAPARRWWRRRVTRDPAAITSPWSRHRSRPNGSGDCARTSTRVTQTLARRTRGTHPPRARAVARAATAIRAGA